MKISVAWTRYPKGNGIKEGAILRVSAPGASHISGAIYKNGSPKIALFGYGSKARVKVKRARLSLKGNCILKIRAYDKIGRGFGIDDIFQVY